MNNDKRKDYKIGIRKFANTNVTGRVLRSVASTTVPEAYYNRIKSKRAVTKHHPIWEGLNDVLVIKSGRVCIR